MGSVNKKEGVIGMVLKLFCLLPNVWFDRRVLEIKRIVFQW